MPTTWSERIRPTTDWWQRTQPDTSWDIRVRPIIYITPLQDAYTEVADENDEVIYIYADSGREMPLTEWTTRPAI